MTDHQFNLQNAEREVVETYRRICEALPEGHRVPGVAPTLVLAAMTAVASKDRPHPSEVWR